jgi:hypothetical protein
MNISVLDRLFFRFGRRSAVSGEGEAEYCSGIAHDRDLSQAGIGILG